MLGIVIAQKGFVQSAALLTLDHIDLFTVARNFTQGFLVVWYMAVAVAMGLG